MGIKECIDKFYLLSSINELKRMQQDNLGQRISYNTLLYFDIISYTKNCTVSMLADMLGIAKSAVTLKVNEMVKKGLIQRDQSSEDKRVFFLTVTEYAKQFSQQLNIDINRKLQEVDDAFSAQEKATFCNILQTLTIENKE